MTRSLHQQQQSTIGSSLVVLIAIIAILTLSPLSILAQETNTTDSSTGTVNTNSTTLTNVTEVSNSTSPFVSLNDTALTQMYITRPHELPVDIPDLPPTNATNATIVHTKPIGGDSWPPTSSSASSANSASSTTSSTSESSTTTTTTVGTRVSPVGVRGRPGVNASLSISGGGGVATAQSAPVGLPYPTIVPTWNFQMSDNNDGFGDIRVVQLDNSESLIVVDKLNIKRFSWPQPWDVTAVEPHMTANYPSLYDPLNYISSLQYNWTNNRYYTSDYRATYLNAGANLGCRGWQYEDANNGRSNGYVWDRMCLSGVEQGVIGLDGHIYGFMKFQGTPTTRAGGGGRGVYYGLVRFWIGPGVIAPVWGLYPDPNTQFGGSDQLNRYGQETSATAFPTTPNGLAYNYNTNEIYTMKGACIIRITQYMSWVDLWAWDPTPVRIPLGNAGDFLTCNFADGMPVIMLSDRNDNILLWRDNSLWLANPGGGVYYVMEAPGMVAMGLCRVCPFGVFWGTKTQIWQFEGAPVQSHGLWDSNRYYYHNQPITGNAFNDWVQYGAPYYGTLYFQSRYGISGAYGRWCNECYWDNNPDIQADYPRDQSWQHYFVYGYYQGREAWIWYIYEDNNNRNGKGRSIPNGPNPVI